MEAGSKVEASRAIALIDSIKQRVLEVGTGDVENPEKDAKCIRETKMLLLQLKKASRLVFRNMQARIDDIENEIKRADSILVNVHRMESETTSLHKKLSYYQSYKTPSLDKVSLPPVEADESDSSTVFEKKCKGLQEELTERKRLQERLDEENNAKKQRLMTKMQLRHHIQSVVGNQMREVEESMKKVTETCKTVVEKIGEEEEEESEEENHDENKNANETETDATPVVNATAMEEEERN